MSITVTEALRQLLFAAENESGNESLTSAIKNARVALTLNLAVPPDVAELVIAARIVVFESKSSEAIKRLDKASEAFADRIPWEDEPGMMIYNREPDVETKLANALASVAFKGAKVIREDLCNCGALEKFLAGHKPWCAFVAAVKANNKLGTDNRNGKGAESAVEWPSEASTAGAPDVLNQLQFLATCPNMPTSQLLSAIALIKAQGEEIKAHQKEKDECEQIAGKALGYPWYKDDQKNFPGATEANGVCIGEHVTSTIVAELAEAYQDIRIALNDAKEDRSFE